MHDEDQLFEIVKAAFDAFLGRHSALLDVNANERSMTHKLAEALQEVFPDMDVDCEYNRHGGLAKKIIACRDEAIGPDDLDAKTVYPDIVVHKRGTDEDNLLVIEVKKSSGRRCSGWDAEKLRAFTSEEFRYQVGLYVEIDAERESIGKVECYKDGNMVKKDTIWDGLRSPVKSSLVHADM